MRWLGKGDLVIRRASIGLKNAKNGKLATDWEGPYRSVSVTRAYSLKTMKKEELP